MDIWGKGNAMDVSVEETCFVEEKEDEGEVS